MQIKIFGKNVFEFKKNRGEALFAEVQKSSNEQKFLPDFVKIGRNNSSRGWSNFVEVVSIDSPSEAIRKVDEKQPPKSKPPKITLTPKGLYQLKTLNDDSFQLNTDPKYIDEQIEEFKAKLGIVEGGDFDLRRGLEELTSIIVRLENRKKYPSVKKFFEEFPYTTPSKIDAVMKDNTHLKIDNVGQFIADLPKEATQVMKDYNKHTKEVCDKQAVFYIIADKKDFEKTNSRRDPILLAQSPFGHFWQILGAWDKEMLLLEKL